MERAHDSYPAARVQPAPWAPAGQGRGGGASRHAPLRLLLVLALLAGCIFAVNVFESDRLPTVIYPLGASGYDVTARLAYTNVELFHKENPENFPDRPDELYLPPPEDAPYSEDSFSTERLPLEGAPVYFTYDGKAISDLSGKVICYPAEPTGAKGETSCTAEYYFDSIGSLPENLKNGDAPEGEVKSIEAGGKCGVISAYFRGIPSSGKEYGYSSQSAVLCSSQNAALSALGAALPVAIGSAQNAGICFPVILIAGLLIASMYYSGRDPLSLFDLTTPRLPRMKQFRVKAGTSPQVVRSLVRRLAMIQRHSRRDAMRVFAALAAARGMSKWQAKRDVNKLFRKLSRELTKASASGEGMDMDKLSAFTGELVNKLRDKYAPKPLVRNASDSDRKKFEKDMKHFARSARLVAPYLQIYNQAYQAMKTVGEARGSSGHRLTKLVGKGFDKLTSASIRLEDTRGVQVIGRIPVLRAVINVPTKMFDSAAQLRG